MNEVVRLIGKTPRTMIKGMRVRISHDFIPSV